MREYLDLPAVSASLLNSIEMHCHRAAWFHSWLNEKRPLERSTSEQGTGTLAHELILEGELKSAVVLEPSKYPNKGDGGIPTGYTNPAIRAARDAVISAGKVPLLPGEDEPIRAMARGAFAYIDTLRELEPAVWAAFQPEGGESEIVILWQERDGTWCKVRPDRISLDRRVLINLKTTAATAEPATWFRRTALSLGYPLSSAFYRRGIEQALRIDSTEVWLVQEQAAPNLCSLVGLDPMGLHSAELRMMRALRAWQACAAAGNWPAYPSRVAYPEMPPWELARDTGRAGIEQDGDLMGREFAIARDSVNKTWDQHMADERAPAA